MPSRRWSARSSSPSLRAPQTKSEPTIATGTATRRITSRASATSVIPASVASRTVDDRHWRPPISGTCAMCLLRIRTSHARPARRWVALRRVAWEAAACDVRRTASPCVSLISHASDTGSLEIEPPDALAVPAQASGTLAQATARSQDHDLCRGHRVRVVSRASLTTSPLIQPNLMWVRRSSRVVQRSGAAVQATQMPFSCTTLPSSSMRPPKRRSLTMSQWIAETFEPPISSKP